MANEKLSPHFSEWEFRCKCCGRLLVDKFLLAKLEELRHKIGDKPINVTSGYRCVDKVESLRKEKLDEIKFSYHMVGKAADCHTSLPLLEFLIRANEVFGSGGIGVYPLWVDPAGKSHDGFLHLDTREHRGIWGRVENRYTTMIEAIEYECNHREYPDGVLQEAKLIAT